MEFSRGILDMLLAAFFFSLMAVFVKATGSRIPSQEIVLFRSIIVFAITAYWIRRKGLPLLGNNHKLLFLRGFFGFVGLSAFYFTLTHIPIADSVMLQYTSPLFTALLAIFILKEPTPLRLWGYFLLAFVGILLIIRPGLNLQFLPATVGLIGAMGAGVAYNLVRKLRETDHPLHIILSLPAVSILFSLPLVASNFVMPRGWEWLMLLGVGVSTQIAQVFLTRGLHTVTAARATNVTYINVVFSAMWGLLLWHEIPDWRSVMGAMLILFAIFKIGQK
ncbi:MAG: DMT family transporter [Calditrichaeota bacterium]|nr:DMT family transporter [Calditrichota bacterium]